MAWHQFFIVGGLSFSCEMDKCTLSILNGVEDELPIGESKWVVVNQDKDDLDKSCSIIQGYLPRAKFYPIHKGLKEWVDTGLAELVDIGILSG
jgi:hypothetical protein